MNVRVPSGRWPRKVGFDFGRWPRSGVYVSGASLGHRPILAPLISTRLCQIGSGCAIIVERYSDLKKCLRKETTKHGSTKARRFQHRRGRAIARFDRLYSPKKRSEIVQRLMVQAMEANAAEVADAAMKIATDPSYREYDDVSDWTDAQAIDTLREPRTGEAALAGKIRRALARRADWRRENRTFAPVRDGISRPGATRTPKRRSEKWS